ncbi:hypothetical protein TI03_04985, partial [Achromatium sp. WMS1]
NLSQDPLIQGQHVSIGNEWLHQADYDVPPMFNTNLISKITASNQETITILGHTFNTQVITENVTYPNGMYSQNWDNKFWYEYSSGILLKSIQKLGPNADSISTTYISHAVRLISKHNRPS